MDDYRWVLNFIFYYFLFFSEQFNAINLMIWYLPCEINGSKFPSWRNMVSETIFARFDMTHWKLNCIKIVVDAKVSQFSHNKKSKTTTIAIGGCIKWKKFFFVKSGETIITLLLSSPLPFSRWIPFCSFLLRTQFSNNIFLKVSYTDLRWQRALHTVHREKEI